MKMYTKLDDLSSRTSKTPKNKFQLFSSNQLSSSSFIYLGQLENSIASSFKNRNKTSLKNTNEFFDTKTSLTSRTTTYSTNFKVKGKGDNFDSKYKSLLDHVMEKRKTDESAKHSEFFAKENGKDDFISKFREIKQGINKSSKQFSNNSSLNSQSTSFYKTVLGVENSNFLRGNTSKQLFIKKNVETLFPKKKETIFSSFKSVSTVDTKLTVNSKQIPNEIYGKIKKTLPEFVNTSYKDIFEKSDNKVKIEKMKEKVNKFFK